MPVTRSAIPVGQGKSSLLRGVVRPETVSTLSRSRLTHPDPVRRSADAFRHCSEHRPVGVGDQKVRRPPAGAVARHHEVRSNRHQLADRTRDDRLEQTAGQVHPADEGVHDSKLLEPLVDAVPPIRRPVGQPGRRASAQASCTARTADFAFCRRVLRQGGITPRIARRRIESSERSGRHRWIVERTNAWMLAWRRLTIRFDRQTASVLAFLHLPVRSSACASSSRPRRRNTGSLLSRWKRLDGAEVAYHPPVERVGIGVPQRRADGLRRVAEQLDDLPEGSPVVLHRGAGVNGRTIDARPAKLSTTPTARPRSTAGTVSAISRDRDVDARPPDAHEQQSSRRDPVIGRHWHHGRAEPVNTSRSRGPALLLLGRRAGRPGRWPRD